MITMNLKNSLTTEAGRAGVGPSWSPRLGLAHWAILYIWRLHSYTFCIQKSVTENMADCDVKRVTGPYFFRMIADQ